MLKKRLFALSAAAALLLTACEFDDPSDQKDSSYISPAPPSASETKAPVTTTQPEASQSGEITAGGSTISEITDPSAPEVIPAEFTEEQLKSGYLYLSGDEQFTVSKNKNIITVILDAADTEYVTKLFKQKPKAFKALKDFTLYTNTCGVFDSTFQSLTQIYSGYTELPVYKIAQWNQDAWESEKAVEFYRRFHKAGYKMNFFVDADWELRHQIGKADNLALSDEPVSGRDFYHGNFGFDDMVRNVSAAEDDYNYFIVQHLWGAHKPIEKDTFAEQMEYLFDIVDNYLEKLKEFNVYDNSTIIIMGDHGSHDLYNYPDSTPLFMIKEAGKHNDKIKFSSAPIYFADLMSTYLVNAGLYSKETDMELFGSSIYDFEEGEERERTANYRYYSSSYPPSGISPLCHSYGYNVIYSYTYTGNRKNLLKVINDGKFEVTWMEEDAA